MNEPRKQIKEFWEGYGFERTEVASGFNTGGQRVGLCLAWRYPDGKINQFEPDIDLNNLFKYAVPFLVDEIGLLDVRKLLVEWARRLTGDYEKDTLALFWALDEVRRQSK